MQAVGLIPLSLLTSQGIKGERGYAGPSGEKGESVSLHCSPALGWQQGFKQSPSLLAASTTATKIFPEACEAGTRPLLPCPLNHSSCISSSQHRLVARAVRRTSAGFMEPMAPGCQGEGGQESASRTHPHPHPAKAG